MNWLETKFWKLTIYIIRKGYGADCETTDLEDLHGGGGFNGLDPMPRRIATANDVFSPSRCVSCRARETIDWIQKHIDLINYK